MNNISRRCSGFAATRENSTSKARATARLHIHGDRRRILYGQACRPDQHRILAVAGRSAGPAGPQLGPIRRDSGLSCARPDPLRVDCAGRSRLRLLERVAKPLGAQSTVEYTSELADSRSWRRRRGKHMASRDAGGQAQWSVLERTGCSRQSKATGRFVFMNWRPDPQRSRWSCSLVLGSRSSPDFSPLEGVI